MSATDLYHVYQLVDGVTGSVWTRKSGHAMTYSDAKNAERVYQASGMIACLFDADAPAEIQYSPDAHAERDEARRLISDLRRYASSVGPDDCSLKLKAASMLERLVDKTPNQQGGPVDKTGNSQGRMNAKEIHGKLHRIEDGS